MAKTAGTSRVELAMTPDQTACSLQPHPEFGFLQVPPAPSAEEITRFYAEEFYCSGDRGFSNAALEVLTRDQEFHERRMAYEMNMSMHGLEKELHQLYQSLGERKLGRQMITNPVSR